MAKVTTISVECAIVGWLSMGAAYGGSGERLMELSEAVINDRNECLTVSDEITLLCSQDLDDSILDSCLRIAFGCGFAAETHLIQAKARRDCQRMFREAESRRLLLYIEAMVRAKLSFVLDDAERAQADLREATFRLCDDRDVLDSVLAATERRLDGHPYQPDTLELLRLWAAFDLVALDEATVGCIRQLVETTKQQIDDRPELDRSDSLGEMESALRQLDGGCLGSESEPRPVENRVDSSPGDGSP